MAKLKLLGSDYGKHILIDATNSTGTFIHRTQNRADLYDEIYLYAINNYGSDVNLTIEWGETYDASSPYADQIKTLIEPSSGLYVVVEGLLLQKGLTVYAYADVSNVLSINGYINRSKVGV
tara:strand:- start:482 stop:844 length:363 start_codon:yes stop_codon:yes gene_type:complete